MKVEALPLFLDRLVGTIMAIVISVTLIVLFGEYVPLYPPTFTHNMLNSSFIILLFIFIFNIYSILFYFFIFIIFCLFLESSHKRFARDLGWP